MYPELFRIGDFSVSSFGLMLAIAFLVGSRISAVRMREQGVDPDLAWNLLAWVMLGGILGSKLYFAVDTHLRMGAPFWGLLLSRDGITWYGGLMGATAVGAFVSRRVRLWSCQRCGQQNTQGRERCFHCDSQRPASPETRGISVKSVMDATAVAAALGQAIGRVGCFLVGDDYGRVTDVPWAVSFPNGAPPTLDRVHPTQIYEILWLVPVALLLWRRRKRSPFLFGEYVALNGLGRIFIEMLRVNPKVAFGLTEPQIVGIALIVAGVSSWLYFQRKDIGGVGSEV
jgi:phosphatidylglycerol:prolipoprotein diacylglycerol transferase